VRGLRRPGRPRGAHLQPHRQRPGEDLRLRGLPGEGAAGAVRGEGRAAGPVRHSQVRPGGPEAGGPRRPPRGAPGPVWGGGPGGTGPGAPGHGGGPGHPGGHHSAFGKGGRTMTALLRKDLYVADKQMRLVVVLALVFSVIPQMETFGATYALVLAFLLPISTIT